MKILFTTVPGIEDLVVQEIRTKLRLDIDRFEKIGISELGGRIIVEFPDSNYSIIKNIKNLHTVERAFLVIAQGEIGPKLDDLVKVINEINLEWLKDYVTNFTTIAVKCVRAGDHEYTSLDVARKLGQKIVNYLKSQGINTTVCLDNPDIVIEFDIIGNRYILSIELIRRSLRERKYRVFHHEASINPILAYAMNMLLNYDIDKEYVLMDPMCGSGTIVIEGCFYYEKALYIGADIDKRNVKGAIRNVLKAGFASRVALLTADVKRLSNYVKYVDGIVTNPPYGIRMEPLDTLERFYNEFIMEFYKVLDSGSRAVIITPRRGLMLRALQKCQGFIIENQVTVEQGGMLSTIFVLKKE